MSFSDAVLFTSKLPHVFDGAVIVRVYVYVFGPSAAHWVPSTPWNVSVTVTHFVPNSVRNVGFVKSNGVVVETEPPPCSPIVAVTALGEPSGSDAL